MARDFRRAEHLPKRSPSGEPAPPEELPRQRHGITPQLHGRYPDHDVLAQAGHWDAATRAVVLDRVANVPPLRFFDPDEARALRAFCDVVLAQDADPRVPVLELVDARLHAGRLDGFRYADMPPDPETWREVARRLDGSARERGAPDFAGAAHALQRELVGAFQRGELEWDGLPVRRAFSVVMRMVLAAFYSHPWAWNEIGFGGPAYPRGYARMGAGQREWWEGAPAFERDPVADVHERGLE
ncbi:MAG TPA: gluconate 2-dehydrogenase subunit 3 family protein [Conexibacter sp.]|nr:gluconate 2-dehydrogenase subunit 3 family protein [Conexibacter sp.]